MGLLLSILIVCVGVIEALSCYDHFQYGVLNCATSAYETARRRSSAFLKYGSRKLGFSFEEPVIEHDEESDDKHERPETNTRQLPPPGPKPREKKLAKEEKIEIVKKLFESSTRPKPMRSISSPGLIYTRRDVELTNIINDLAGETIDELNAEDSNVLTAEFDKLFNEYEKSGQNVPAETNADIFGEKESKTGDKTDANEQKESSEMEIIDFEKDDSKAPSSKKAPEIINGTASVDSDKLISREIDKSTSGDVDPGDLSKICARPPTHDSFPIKSPVPEESTSRNELADGIFESERDLDSVADISGEIRDGEDLGAVCEEITKGEEIVDQRQASDFDAPKREVFSIGDDEKLFLKAVEQLADLIVAKCLNKGMKTAVSFNAAPAIDDPAKLPGAIQLEKKKASRDFPTADLLQGNNRPNNDREKARSALDGEKIQKMDSDLRDDSNFGESLVEFERLRNPEKGILTEDCEKMEKTLGNWHSEALGVEKPSVIAAIALQQSPVNGLETPQSFELGGAKMLESSDSDVLKGGDGNIIPECKYVLPVEMEKPDLRLTADLVESPEEKHQKTFSDQPPESKIDSVDNDILQESSNGQVKPEVILALEYLEKPHPNEDAVPVEGNTVQEQPVPEEKLQDCQNDGKQSKEANFDSRADFPDSKEEAKVSGVNTGKVFDCNLENVTTNLVEELENDNDRRLKSPSEAPNGGAKEASSSASEAFWLIFSGEYTKAMSKDWHSGHFSCWQCDEALTGQRYVLRDDHPYCIKCYESVFANVCEECNKIIGIDSKDLSYKDKHWHEACFLCNKCRVSLVDKQFGSKAEKIYCGNCYDAQFASRCDGCGEIFRAGTKKMEYKTRQWHEKCFCCCVCKTPIGTKSFIPREQEIYCATCYEEKFATRCVKCNKIITSGGVTYKNEPWHRECFTCTSCNTSLAGQRFTSRDEKPYCADCFGELFAKRCTACSRPITGIGGTRFISFENRHWHNDCFICASCKTSLVGRGFITDGDDIICPECAKQKLM